MTSHYDALGVSRDADQETIKRAYRVRAAATHPDKEGGSDDAFHAVRRAYETLSDSERRKFYDKTGQDRKRSSDHAEEFLLDLFNRLIDEGNTARDYVRDCRLLASTVQASLNQNIGKVQREIAKLEKLMGRIKSKDDVNFFESIVVKKLQLASAQLADLKENLDHVNRALMMLDGYSDASPGSPAAYEFGRMLFVTERTYGGV